MRIVHYPKLEEQINKAARVALGKTDYDFFSTRNVISYNSYYVLIFSCTQVCNFQNNQDKNHAENFDTKKLSFLII